MHVICLSQQVTYILCLWLPDISTFILDFQVTIEVINFMQLFVITKLTKRSLTSKDCLWKLTLNIRLSLLCCNPPDYRRMLLGGWRKGYGDNCHKNRTLLPEIKNHRIAVGGTGSFITSHVLCRSQCQVWGFEWSVSLQRRLVFWVFFCVCVCLFFPHCNFDIIEDHPCWEKWDEDLPPVKSEIRDSFLCFSFLKSMGKTIALGW